MGNTRFLKIIIALLLLLNFGLLAFMWFNKPPAMHERGWAARYLIEQIGFDSEQTAAYRKLIEGHRSHLNTLRVAGRNASDRYFQLLGQKTADDPAAMALLDTLLEVRRQEEMHTFRHFTEVRQLCRPEQVAKFDAAIGEALRSLRPRPPK